MCTEKQYLESDYIYLKNKINIWTKISNMRTYIYFLILNLPLS